MAEYTDEAGWSDDDLRDLEYEDVGYSGVRCKYCGKGGMRWGQVGIGKSGWRLFDNGELHSCKGDR